MTDHSASHAGTARRWATISLLAAVLASLLLPGVATAAGIGATVVTGTQLAYGTCGANRDGYQMTGDLVGCWWITEFESTTDASKHNVRATGTELFIGSLGSLSGSFTTTFGYTAKMDGPWVSSAEIHGRCHHPVVAGTGDFAGISGELNFTDVNVNPPSYPYWGNLRIAGQSLTLNSATTGALPSSGVTTALSC